MFGAGEDDEMRTARTNNIPVPIALVTMAIFMAQYTFG